MRPLIANPLAERLIRLQGIPNRPGKLNLLEVAPEDGVATFGPTLADGSVLDNPNGELSTYRHLGPAKLHRLGEASVARCDDHRSL